MIGLGDNNNSPEGRRSFLSGFKDGIYIATINDIKMESRMGQKGEFFDITLDISINNVNYKFVKFTPFFINKDDNFNPDPNSHLVADLTNKLKQICIRVASQPEETKNINGNTIFELIDNFKRTINYKGRCAIYIEKRKSKSGYEFLCIPASFGNTIVFSSKMSDINYKPYVKPEAKEEKAETQTTVNESNNTNVNQEIEQNIIHKSSDDLPF
jgi:hypothetical protein